MIQGISDGSQLKKDIGLVLNSTRYRLVFDAEIKHRIQSEVENLKISSLVMLY